jgi:membrane protein DedA with SNARE-associated domain
MASIIEEIIAIIPSSVVQMGAGFLFLGGQEVGAPALVTLLFMVVLPATLGVMVGSLPIYYATYFGGKPVIERFGRYFSVSWEEVERVEQHFAASGKIGRFIFICRALPVMPSVVITTFSGIVRVPVYTYLLYTFLGTLVRAGILGVVGWQLGALYRTYAPYVDRLEKVGFVLIGGAVLLWYVRQRRKTKTQDKSL